MSEYPEIRDFLEGFANRYTRNTEIGSILMVTGEELQTLSDFLVRGMVDWVGVAGANDAEDHPALGKFLDDFVDQHARKSDVGVAVSVSEEEIIGLGLSLREVLSVGC